MDRFKGGEDKREVCSQPMMDYTSRVYVIPLSQDISILRSYKIRWNNVVGESCAMKKELLPDTEAEGSYNKTVGKRKVFYADGKLCLRQKIILRKN